MAEPIREFLGDVTINLNQLKSHVIDRIVGLVKGPSPAASPTATRGRILYNDTDEEAYLGNGTVWRRLINAMSGTVGTLGIWDVIPAPAEGTATPNEATSQTAVFATKGRQLVNFDRFNFPGMILKGKLYVQAYVSNPGAHGEARLRNVDDNVVLALLDWTENVATRKTIDLSSIPTAGIKEIDFEIRRDVGAGQFVVEIAMWDITREEA